MLYPVELRALWIGRGREIRTPDILLPKQARYLAALYPGKTASTADHEPPCGAHDNTGHRSDKKRQSRAARTGGRDRFHSNESRVEDETVGSRTLPPG